MPNSFTVYKHTSPSGKIYVGITSQRLEARWRGGLGYSHNPLFMNAIVKYGWDNFTHEILFTGLTQKEACAKEIELIAKYKSNDRAYGYNMTTGGDGSAGSVRSEEYRNGQRARTLGLWSDPNYRAHMSKAHKGKKQSEETIERRRQSYLLGHPVSEKTRSSARERLRGNTNRARAVICLETGEAFATIKAAAQWAGIATTGIHHQLRGFCKTAGGYHWKYLEEDENGST